MAGENGDTAGDGDKEAGEEFRICDFPDIRKLRQAYLRYKGKPIVVDSTDSPRPDAGEEDFGLSRSTDAEALEFFRQMREEDEDFLREFLDDGE